MRRQALFAGALALAVLATGGARATPHNPAIGAPQSISGLSPFAATCSGATGAAHNTEVEPSVAVDPSNPDRVVAVWQQDRFASHGGAQSNVVGYSSNAGATWARALMPGISRCTAGIFERATDPWVSIGPSGVAYVASLSFDGQVNSFIYRQNALYVSRSTDGGATWSQPALAAYSPGVILHDKEAVTADPTDPSLVYLVWLSFPGGVYLSRSIDGGATWLPHVPIPSLGQGNEIVVLPDGTLLNVNDSAVNRSTDHGTTWSLPISYGDINASRAHAEDGGALRVGDFIPTADASPDGSAYIAWHEEDFGGAGYRIAFTRSTDGGRTWSEPEAAATSAAPMFTPSIAVADDGTVGVTYYDLRNEVPGDGETTTDVWFSWSRDGGATWTERHIAGPFDIERAPYAEGYFLGDYQGLEAGARTFQAIFSMATPSGPPPSTDIYSVRVAFP